MSNYHNPYLTASDAERRSEDSLDRKRQRRLKKVLDYDQATVRAMKTHSNRLSPPCKGRPPSSAFSPSLS